MGDAPFMVDAAHFDMILHPDALQYMLSLVAQPVADAGKQVVGQVVGSE
jgi:hypothetical protein